MPSKADSSAFTLVPLLARVVAGRDLSTADAKNGFDHIMVGKASPVRTGALLAAMQTKGLAPSEVAGGVGALRDAMIPVNAPNPCELVDTCGTGGGGVSTFNISTAAALVAAAGGVRMAKHGNRSFTSRCGSADVLEALGVKLTLSPQGMAEVLAAAGIVFMFAPLLHPAMRHVGPVRRELGITTIMNLLGPLTNPAGARRQVVGVADPGLLDLVARALAKLDHERAMVVHGEPGLDEISPCGPTHVRELRGGEISSYDLTPEDLGLARSAPEALAGGEPEENAAAVRAVICGDDQGPKRDAVLANAAAAFLVAGRVPSLREGVRVAANAIDSGAAASVLEDLVQASRLADAH